jgi:hypothetical protein
MTCVIAEQYLRSFEAAFGASVVNVADLPKDPQEEGFDNNAGQAFVGEVVAQRYRENAVAMGARVSANLAAEAACLTGANPDDACVTEFITKYATRAFRRPVAEDETSRYLAAYRAVQAQTGSKDAAAAVLELLAQSPNFLYRTEIGEGAGDETRLTHYEIASELSYMLTDSPPDAELLAAAADEALHDKAVVLAQAERLVETPAAREKVGRFFQQYLKITGLADAAVAKDTALFPAGDYSAAHQADMLKESTEFSRYIVFDDDGTLGSLFSSPFSFVTKRLADLYGAKGADSNTELSMVAMPEGERAGVLMQAAFLSVRAKADETDPLHRGLFVFEDMLCQKTSPPPDVDLTMVADLLVSPEANATKKEDFEFFQENSPACAGCHSLFVPFGLSLENYDAIGRFRTSEHSKPLEVAGTFAVGDEEQDGDYKNAVELVQKVSQSDRGEACFVERYTTFALGRHAKVSTKAPLANDFSDTGASIRDLLVEVTQDDVFYYRAAAAAAEENP